MAISHQKRLKLALIGCDWLEAMFYESQAVSAGDAKSGDAAFAGGSDHGDNGVTVAA